MKKWIPWGICLCFIGCTTPDLAQLRSQGTSEMRKLKEELQQIQSKEELERKVPFLKERFSRIAKILIAMQKCSKEPQDPTPLSEELFLELVRLYQMKGGKELIEQAQLEAVHKLKREWEKRAF